MEIARQEGKIMQTIIRVIGTNRTTLKTITVTALNKKETTTLIVAYLQGSSVDPTKVTVVKKGA